MLGQRFDQSVRIATNAPSGIRPCFFSHRIIGILGYGLMDIDHHEREDHFLDVDPIDGAHAFYEMRRRIDMRSPLSHMREGLRIKSAPEFSDSWFIPIQGFQLLVGKTFPMRNTRRERMGKIDELLFLDDTPCILESESLRGHAGRRCQQKHAQHQ